MAGLLAALMVGGGLLILTLGLGARLAPPADGAALEADFEEIGTRIERLIDQFTAPLVAGGRATRTADQLLRADINLRPQEWYAFRVLVPMLAGLWVFLLNGILPIAIAIGMLMYLVPGLLLRARRHSRRAALVRQLPEALVIMTNSLESGSTVLQALEVVAETMTAPMGDEFVRVTREVSLGVPADEALGHIASRFESKDFAIVVSAVQLNRQMGGSLAEVLKSIIETLRDRVRLADRIRVLTAQSRASAYIVSGLPFGVAVILLVIAPGYMAPMFTNPIGYAAILLALLLFSLAWVVMGRITNIEL
ncbi:MAG: tight adherence protein [Chloroflexota bacterium]|jgi:tight adherence protein B|nr:tight adherence protein [Chloroflexota bacterium]